MWLPFKIDSKFICVQSKIAWLIAFQIKQWIFHLVKLSFLQLVDLSLIILSDNKILLSLWNLNQCSYQSNHARYFPILMEHFVNRPMMLPIILIVSLMKIYARIQFNGQFLQTQLKVKPSDGIKAKDISLQQCKEVQHLAMIFKMILLQAWNALNYLFNVNNCFKDNWLKTTIHKPFKLRPVARCKIL